MMRGLSVCLLLFGHVALASGRDARDLRVSVEGSRIVQPGESVTASLTASGGEAIRYGLFLRDERTLELIPAGEAAFPASPGPVAREVLIPLKAEGLYTLLAKAIGETAPADFQAGFLLAAKRKEPPKASGKPASPFRFAGLFHNGVVLQREKPLPVWGWAEPGEKIAVSLAGQNAEAIAGGDGRWQVEFTPLPAGGPHELKAVSSSGKEIVCDDVLAGEVWLLSGQSNMGGELPTCVGGNDAATKANFPGVRIGPVLVAPTEIEGRLSAVWWMKAVSDGDPKKMQKWGGIHYAFGTELHKELGVPIGLLAASRGGTSISTWTSRPIHESEPIFRPVLQAHQKDQQENAPERQHLQRLARQIAEWRKNTETAQREGKPGPALPKLTAEVEEKNAPGLLYHQLIEPIAPFAIRGVLWYQGENDTGRAEAYRRRFPIMIESWRDLWNSPDLPFLFVQLAYAAGRPEAGKPDPEEPGDEPWGELREAQWLTLAVPNTAMAVSYDLVRPENDVHYNDKMPVGHRLALAALATVYGKDVDYQGPLYKQMKVENGAIRLSFDHAEGGLEAKGGKLGGFAIAGEDREWVWADAGIDGETIVVRSDKVPRPAAVRYAWTRTPCGANLYNKAGLPAPSFRTDDWPLSTAGKE